MKRLTLLCMLLLLCAINSVAQTAERVDYAAAYDAVTSGVFANSTYPAWPIFKGATDDDERKSFTLKHGLFEPGLNQQGYIRRLGAYLKSVEFGDVTGDGCKEAIVAVGNICDCSGVWFGIYIYKLAGRNRRVFSGHFTPAIVLSAVCSMCIVKTVN